MSIFLHPTPVQGCPSNVDGQSRCSYPIAQGAPCQHHRRGFSVMGTGVNGGRIEIRTISAVNRLNPMINAKSLAFRHTQVSTGSSSLGPVRKCFTYPPTGLSHRFRPIMGQATVSRTAAGSTDKKSRATEAT